MTQNTIPLRNEIYQSLLGMLILREEHIKDLQRRGFNLETIIKNGYKSIPDNEYQRIKVAEELFSIYGPALFDVPGFYLKVVDGMTLGPRMMGNHELIIPSRSNNGQIYSLILRKDKVGGSKKRYTHLSCKELNNVDLSPTPHFPLGTFDHEQIILTEGSIKGDIIAQYLGIASSCLPGVTSWRQFINTVDFTSYKYCDIAFDRDLETNKHVAKSCLNLFKHLFHKNIHVRLATWDKVFKGIDDALCNSQSISYLEKDEAKKYLEQVFATQKWEPINWNADDDLLFSDGTILSWNEIRPLPEIHFPAPRLDFNIVPAPLRDWIEDSSTRMQSHPEFLCSSLFTLYSSIIGRSISVKPKEHDNWKIVPILWGLLIGLPSSKKSPCLSETRKFIDKIQNRLDEEFKEKIYAWKAFESSKQVQIKSIDESLKTLFKDKEKNHVKISQLIDEKKDIEQELGSAKPVHQRIYINDVTTEVLQEILRDNPNGIGNIRDELSGFLMSLEKPGRENDRAFYLECYNGSDLYNVARIGRGSIKFYTCASILGGIQPDTLKTILIDGIKTGANNDGFTQRFQLSVWPEFSKSFEYIDRLPNAEAYERVQSITEKMFEFREKQKPGEENSVHFDQEAQLLFQNWITDIERRARSGHVHPPALAAHILKYPKLMCSLALIFQLVDVLDANLTTEGISISLKNAKLAIAWCTFLEAHALKIYSNAVSDELSAADSLSEKILSKDIEDGMPIREIYRKGWSNLTKKELVYAGLEVLEDYGWARLEIVESSGAPKKLIKINPQLYEKEVQY